MADPWQCPACKTWIRPDVTEHRCPPPDGVLAVTGPFITPGGAPRSITTNPYQQSGVTISFTGDALMPGVMPQAIAAHARRYAMANAWNIRNAA